MGDMDMLGSWREQVIVYPKDNPIPPSKEVKELEGKKIKFYTLCLLFINIAKLGGNLDTIDNRSYIRVTDTGGRTHKFIENNPQYKFGYLSCFNSDEYRVDFFSKNTTDRDEAEIIHYRCGSLWDNQSILYYKYKLNNMLKRYIPDFAADLPNPSEDLVSANKEHIIKSDGTIISRYF